MPPSTASRSNGNMAGSVLLLVVVLVLTPGCVVRRWHLHAFPRCADGLPVEVLVDVACPPDGICGYSCLPRRWDVC
jgi:hypothetical protein